MGSVYRTWWGLVRKGLMAGVNPQAVGGVAAMCSGLVDRSDV